MLNKKYSEAFNKFWDKVVRGKKPSKIREDKRVTSYLNKGEIVLEVNGCFDSNFSTENKESLYSRLLELGIFEVQKECA